MEIRIEADTSAAAAGITTEQTIGDVQYSVLQVDAVESVDNGGVQYSVLQVDAVELTH